MNTLNQIIEKNKFFVNNLPQDFINFYCPRTSKIPSRKLAIFTCMDTRLVEFLEPAMGIVRGEAHVIKNAGNSIAGSFESTIRSLVISIFELGVQEVLVIGHLDCGLANTTSRELIQKMVGRNISLDAIKMIEQDLEEWVDRFHHPIINIESVVEKIRVNPLIPKDVLVHGLLFNPQTGELTVVVNGLKYVDA